MAETQLNIKEITKERLEEPRRYNVVLHNDDFTTMEFVVMVLGAVFKKSESEANVLMMKVHREGKAIAGTYSYDIANTKKDQAMRLARSNGFPLVLTVERA